MEHTEAELENFRRQWREEVSAKAKPKASRTTQESQAPVRTVTGESSKGPKKTGAAGAGAGAPPSYARPLHEGWDEIEPRTYHDLPEKELGRKLDDDVYGMTVAGSSKEPSSALDHYEKAVEKETQGRLGDSVSLYRKAFKMDGRVHEAYKKKYFPPSAFAGLKQTISNPNPPNAPVTVPSTAHHSLHGLPASMSELMKEFSQLSIPHEEPPTDLSPSPPCPISEIPEEILEEILLRTAIADVASFTRLAQVCKRMAYLTMTEDRIWKRVVEGHEYGFGGMHYRYTCNVDGSPLLNASGMALSDTYSYTTPRIPAPLLSIPLVPSYPSYRHMFRTRPRIRFNGCYISTVNYTRPGLSSPTQITWNSPVLIVTYYRYLRLFRDGTAISLLTTAEPADVVHHLTKENMQGQYGHGGALPAAVMKDALRGRWRLSGDPFRGALAEETNTLDSELGFAAAGQTGSGVKGTAAASSAAAPEEQEQEAEGDLHIETDGAVPKYVYRMQFSLGSAGRGARNNKLVWKGYWSWNRLTDDWGEFGLKNDKAFYWSRVRSFGRGT
ncbi:hypothetical protein LTS18_006458 [Coniosporium uncinatum]|uniref:Uncharacterized protein n=1 Tax=Coniosporium uncinatum TaxID=93489 RepID=A0ACC3DAN1_9PEZI|nr:hypothetical protein LTS18_006458 [Coniosporium uncinatum]